MLDFNYYLLDKDEDFHDVAWKLYKKTFQVADHIDKRQMIKDALNGTNKMLEDLYAQIKKEKYTYDTFLIREDIKIDPSPTGITAQIKGGWETKEYIENKLKKPIADIEYKLRVHTSYHCPLCGKEMNYDKQDSRCVDCKKCGVGFIIHGIKGMDTKAGDSFSITYLH